MFGKTFSRGYFRAGFYGYFRGYVPLLSAPGTVNVAIKTPRVIGSKKTASIYGNYKLAQVAISLKVLQGEK